MLGAVAGGGDPAAVTAALDPRVAAVIPFNFGEAGPEEHYTDGPRGYPFDTAWPGWGEWETTRCLPRSSVDQFFPWFLCASVAPRHFLYSFEIGWPEDVEHEPAWARYKKVFELYGLGDHLDEVHGFGPFPGPGECTNVGALLRQRIYPRPGALAPHLHARRRVPQPPPRFRTDVPDSGGRGGETAPGQPVRSRLQRCAINSLRRGLRTPPLSGLRAALAEKLGDIEPYAKPSVQLLWEKSGAEASVEALTIETAPGINSAHVDPEARACRDEASARGPRHCRRREGALPLGARPGSKCASFARVLRFALPDVRGTGELAATSSRGPGAMDLPETELMLGETPLGARLKDVRTVFHYLASRPDIDPAHIALWGDSFAETNADDFAFDQSEMQEPGPFAQHQAEPMGALLAL